MTSKHILAIIATVALVAAFAIPAQKQVIICKDGRRLEGEVTKVKDGYQIRMKGGTVVIAKDQVLKVEDVVTVEDELTKRLAKLDSRDAEGHYLVARWAYDQNLLTDSRKILKKVLKLNPKHEDAPKLLKLVNTGIAKSGDTTTPTTTTKNGGKKPAPSKFLTKEDIYRIRLMELKSDDRVSVQFRNKVLQRFIKSMRGSGDFENRGFENKFRGYNRVKQVLYILEWTDRDNATIRDDILIKTDPKVIKEFRARIWPIIAKSFASPSCYGGVKPRDGLKLFNIPLTDERVLYTNFYILHKWERNGRRMIDRDNPEMSLLLQYGLP
ncbi:MAG: hypothetical protein KAV00_05815, partial [Phycisphaerae bacterium]|nr:hypothetical protein [Phycisphaerae bacterium]